MPTASDPISISQRTCQECGMLLDDPGEFHPYAFCAWKRAGLDPWFQLNQILEWLGLDQVPRQKVTGEVLERDEP